MFESDDRRSRPFSLCKNNHMLLENITSHFYSLPFAVSLNEICIYFQLLLLFGKRELLCLSRFSNVECKIKDSLNNNLFIDLSIF